MIVLLATADDAVRHTIRTQLTDKGWDDIREVELFELIDYLGQSKPLIALLGEDQLERLQQIVPQFAKRSTRRSSAHLICLLNSDSPQSAEQAFEHGCDDTLRVGSSALEVHHRLKSSFKLMRTEQLLAESQKMASLGELASGIAHEINTPIQYVGDNTRFISESYGNLKQLLETCQSIAEDSIETSEIPSRLKESWESSDAEYLMAEVPNAIRETLDGIERVTTIVRAMKEFAHPGASEMTLTDLKRAISNTLLVARNEWKYVAELETSFDPNLPSVPCLAGEINQVLLNLIVNAAHAVASANGEDAGKKGKITLRTVLAPPWAEIHIGDSGIGIPEANLNRIFQPFFTTKPAGKGTGQGLAIAHSVIHEKHGGLIDVHSTVGVGTTFIIRLPLRRDEANSSAQDSTVQELGNSNVESPPIETTGIPFSVNAANQNTLVVPASI